MQKAPLSHSLVLDYFPTSVKKIFHPIIFFLILK